MRFLDSSTFLYAYIKPRRQPPPEVADDKRKAQNMIRRIQGGERVATTVVHVSEIANILEARAPLEDSRSITLAVLSLSSITVAVVDSARYIRAIQEAENRDIGINDALAYCYMLENGINEIYSFDKHFDGLPGITRLCE